jgi:hypothetical protein
MRRRLEMDIATCEGCPYLRYNYYYNMQEDSGYDCENINAKHTRIINDSDKSKWTYEIPDWCALPMEVLA